MSGCPAGASISGCDRHPHSDRVVALMDHEFTIESGELTPTLKVKRHVMTQRYAEILSGLMS